MVSGLDGEYAADPVNLKLPCDWPANRGPVKFHFLRQGQAAAEASFATLVKNASPQPGSLYGEYPATVAVAYGPLPRETGTSGGAPRTEHVYGLSGMAAAFLLVHMEAGILKKIEEVRRFNEQQGLSISDFSLAGSLSKGITILAGQAQEEFLAQVLFSTMKRLPPERWTSLPRPFENPSAEAIAKSVFDRVFAPEFNPADVANNKALLDVMLTDVPSASVVLSAIFVSVARDIDAAGGSGRLAPAIEGYFAGKKDMAAVLAAFREQLAADTLRNLPAVLCSMPEALPAHVVLPDRWIDSGAVIESLSTLVDQKGLPVPYEIVD